MSILVVGSVALDSVQTPFGNAKEALGGSATYFSVAASFFTDVRVVAVVGEDFPEEHLAFLKSRSIDLEGLVRVPGRTFRWAGEYGFDLNEAKTLETQLNVFAAFQPEIPKAYKESELVFLANIDPDLQRQVLGQVSLPRLVAADTMNYWINGKPEALRETLKLVDILLINDAETRQLAGEPNLVLAAQKILSWGPTSLVIKRGEYGALMIRKGGWFAAPALPLDSVFDPTGAGDCFAGGFIGYLANTMNFEEQNIRKAIVMGSVMASFNVEAFSLDRLRRLTYPEIEARYKAFKRLTQFEDL
ncbi:sugar kinase [Candidatus Methylomirabilis limnetica]|jgi:sugar/nucleoside kinase (ribokinase family)|uniref:Sugar kinase n=1 Tax=Candidatus Methylomirabilis limnetica TaxID=2033718 RepID=A0A2T4U0J2_9BACT|nr:PfkB family carbohydrate kinase [Candidatus Methylomirabilis limnetica]PTL36883.1 sugar kinase [Candidatus Methylomirabilis limnetica]